jgi:Rrf2 family iron-sulfur cluster assembly transcriptional regulator
VQSARGPGGGYRLARAAEATSIADIVHAVDEPLRATRCGGGAGKGCMAKGARCLTHDLWDDLGHRIEDYLASVSLADVVAGRLSQRAAA